MSTLTVFLLKDFELLYSNCSTFARGTTMTSLFTIVKSVE